VDKIDAQLNGQGKCIEWKLKNTIEISNDLHVIPLIVKLEETS